MGKRVYLLAGMATTLALLATTQAVAAVIYVDDDAPPGGNGASWTTAYRFLQDALVVATAGGEIRVAGGVYQPDRDAAHPSGTGDRNATFQLVNGVTVYGGYSGAADPNDPDARDVALYETVLSGDLAGNDDPNFVNYTENSYHVVTGAAVGQTATLDGLTIAGGNANGGGQLNDGAGLWNNGGVLVLRQVKLRHNQAAGNGGGLYHPAGSSLTMDGCEVVENRANTGGGVYKARSDAVFTGCVFRGNTATYWYGGMWCDGGPNVALVQDCLFEHNVANGGGGWGGGGLTAYCDCYAGVHRHVWVLNCRFVGNAAPQGNGGGLEFYGEDLQAGVANCVFSGNRAQWGGALLYCSPVNKRLADIVNCTFYANTATGQGGGAYTYRAPHSYTNCIFWGNMAPAGAQLHVQEANVTATFCDVQRGADGCSVDPSASVSWSAGDLDVDPLTTPDGHLSAASPCIDAGDPNGTYAGQVDIDGEPRLANGRVDVGADEFIDSDSDGLPDWWEDLYFGARGDADPDADPDADGLTNLEEYAKYASRPTAAPLGVPSPFATIQAALDAAHDGDTVLVAPGVHALSRGPLDFGWKAVVIRGSAGPSQTTLDCGAAAGAVAANTLPGQPAVIEGLTITNGAAANGGGLDIEGARLLVKGCTLTGNQASIAGRGLFAQAATPVFERLTLAANGGSGVTNGVLRDVNIRVVDHFTLTSGTLSLASAWLDGPGQLRLDTSTDPNVRLLVEGQATGDPPSVVRCDILGTGNVWIEAGQALRIEGADTVVDLSGGTGSGCADPNGSGAWGTIRVDGQLVVRDAAVRNTNVVVRSGDLGGAVHIYNNEINLLQNPPGWGGEFFVEGSARIECNVIRSDGDRYLDLDPDPWAMPRPTIGSVAMGNPNRFYVTIKQGVGLEQGELLELRARDYDPNYAGGLSGAHELSSSSGYADTWVLERLEVQSGAKVNLTNRPGFVFQDPNISLTEVLYVKELRLDPDVVLNTGLQRLYYQSLVDENGQPLTRDPNDLSAPMANGSRIVDYPLLGFSLKVIAMEDDTEFAVRVAPRLRDPTDQQPALPPFKEGLIRRWDDPARGGVMSMRTRDPNQLSARSVAAHGAFARAGEDQIVVEFKYRFCGANDPNTMLVVYLSDSPKVGNPASADLAHYTEVARVYPPQPGRPGSIGSGAFATFHGIFPRGSLNFTRGTYVELELRGQDACVEIDDWDPQIKCTSTCHDLSGDNGVTNRDYLLLLAECGQPVPTYKGCLDSKLSEDLYVDIGDVLAWDAVLSTYPPPSNLCDAEPYSGGNGSAVSPPTSGLLIAGKPNGAGVQEDRLYPFNAPGQAARSALLPASAAEGGHYRGNGRLTRDPNGHLYQLHATQGLVRLDTAARVIVPGNRSFGGSTVYVGTTSTDNDVYPNGVPLLDVAFSRSSPIVVYVTPVLVEPPDGAEYTYKAAARLELSGGTYTVTRLYGLDPRSDGCTNTSPPPASECTLQGLREVEVDGQGNLFVLSASAQSANNDWLLVYDESSGAERLRLLLTSLNPALRSPTALLVSEFDPSKLYLSSAVDADPNTPHTHVYRCTIQRSGGAVTGVTLPSGQDIVINNPVSQPNNPLGYLATVTSLQESKSDGRVYVVGFTLARFDPMLSPYDAAFDDDTAAIFTMPTLAQIPLGSSGPITAAALTGYDLALPLSAVFLGSGPALCRGDMNCDGRVTFADIDPFVEALSGESAWNQHHPACPWLNADCNNSGTVTFADIDPFVAVIGRTCP
jgi:hypothetical protein